MTSIVIIKIINNSYVYVLIYKKNLLCYYSNKIYMKNSKHHLKLNNLQVKAEKCSTREEAKKILLKADKAQSKLNK